MSEIVSETMRPVSTALEYGGSYVLLSVVREGRVFLAQKAGKRFVLKTSDGSAQGIESLKREYEIGAGLSHPGLPYVFTYEEVSPVGPCIVQEYVDGRTLGEWLAGNPAAADRRRVFSELLGVMQYLHGKGVIHNDLKPENIMVSRSSGTLKLIDLGFADGDTFVQKSLGGTRRYASPELLRGERVDARSDIYSLGILLDEVFPGRYGRVVRRCTQADPARRYQSAEALQKALDGYYRPIRITLFAVLAAAAVGLLALQQLALRDVKSAAAAQHLVDGRTVDSLENAVGRMASTVDSLSSALDAINSEQSEREIILARAKAAVDQGYARIIPKYETALAGARTQEEATAAWAALSEDYNRMNNKVLTSVPDPLRPSVREYLFERYNGAFPGLYDAFVARVNELSR